MEGDRNPIKDHGDKGYNNFLYYQTKSLFETAKYNAKWERGTNIKLSDIRKRGRERGDFSWKAESSLVKKEIKGISIGKVSVNSMNANSIRGEAIYNYSPIITFSWGFKKINKSVGSLSSSSYKTIIIS